MVKVFTGRARQLLHQRDDGRGIDAAGEERAERDVGDHLPPRSRVSSSALELVDRLLGPTARAGPRRPPRRPPRPTSMSSITRLGAAGGKRQDACPAAAWRCRDRWKAAPGCSCSAAAAPAPRGRSRASKPGCCAQRLELGAEQERPAVPLRARNRAASRPAGRGPGSAPDPACPTGRSANMPIDRSERSRDAPRLDRGEQDLGVRMAAPVMRLAVGRQLAAQLAVIVDLAVEDDDEAPASPSASAGARRRRSTIASRRKASAARLSGSVHESA